MELRRTLAVALLGASLFASGWVAGGASHDFNHASATKQASAAKIVGLKGAHLDQGETALASLGPQTIFPSAGEGYSQGTLSDGRTLGIEFTVAKIPGGGMIATDPIVFDLNDPDQAGIFQDDVNEGARKQALGGQSACLPGCK